MLVRTIFFAVSVGIAAAGAGKPKPPPPPPPPASFGFSVVLGSNMVLQQAPAAAAVYGVAPEGATAVKVTVSDSKGGSYDVVAKVGKDATHQPTAYVDPKGAPLPVANFTWKALLHPTAAGGGYTVTATCTGCTGNTSVASISNVAFGDVWYCSGQSNMWLPVEYSFSRNKTVAAIAAGKYTNIRGMMSPSADTPTAGVWMTAQQAIADGNETNPTYSLFNMGATCWYFAQELADRGITAPIGIMDTAIGGQRIEEFMNNETYTDDIMCPGTINGPVEHSVWDGQLFAKQVMPFVDMSVKGWTWYQGENNMMDPKGNALFNVGYSCKQRELVKGWRAIWSETAGTTDPNAPFGIMTLASSGTEGASSTAMGAMRLAQTAGYGVLPNNEIPNTFFAQAGDLEDAWGPAAGPCFAALTSDWDCCAKVGPHSSYVANRSSASCIAGTHGKPEICDPACAAAQGTHTEGGIHPRSKAPVGHRLGTAAYNLVYKGTGALTGPTIASCSVASTSLTVEFNTTLLSGEKVVLNPYNSSLNNAVAPRLPIPASLVQCVKTVAEVCADHLHNDSDCRNCKADVPGAWAKLQPACGGRPINNFHVSCETFFPAKIPMRGSLFEVLIGDGAADGSDAFCIEPGLNATTNEAYCPPWAGPPASGKYNSDAGKWFQVDITSATATSVNVDLSKLNGKQPVGVRYSWGVFDCCNVGDPLLYVSKPCDTACPITSSTLLPANPFMAKLVGGKCSCVAPQVC